ncbi:MAG: hypothetical protein H7249_02105 [Chitinophagaceae bacterium]|nr:hypothetical protein [Oligoflexus sp.]
MLSPNFRTMILILLPTMALLLGGCVHTGADLTLAEAIGLIEGGNVIEPSPAVAKAILKKYQDRPILIEFSATWCIICKGIKRPLDHLAQEGKGRYIIMRLDVTDDMETLVEYGMKPIYPSFKLFSPGLVQPVKRFGLLSFDSLIAWMRLTHTTIQNVPLQFSQAPLKTPKAVIVAGSAENANFAQEVVWITKILKRKGLKDDEMACFYAKPDPVQYLADQKQFDELAHDLNKCSATSRLAILNATKQGLAANPSTFFLYATSHGAGPSEYRPEKGERDCFTRAPSLILDNGSEEYCDSLNHLTPDAVASAVPAVSPTHKFMVFQSCYSGGFISDQNNAAKYPSALAKLPNMTLLTATRSDRPSFGCGTGEIATYYGFSFAKALEEDRGTFESIDWKTINQETIESIEQLESKSQIREGSDPQFFNGL